MYGLYLLINETLRNKEIQDPHPISDSNGKFNMKSREVYCPNCKYIVITNLPGPKCSQCYSWMITR